MSSSASDTHSRKNVNRPAEEAFVSLLDLVRRAVASGVQVRAGIQCAFGCVYEGPVPEERVLDLGGAPGGHRGRGDLPGGHDRDGEPGADPAPGHPTRASVRNLPLSLHLHDTRGLGLVNALAA